LQIFGRCKTYCQQFRTVYQVALVSLLPHKFQSTLMLYFVKTDYLV
jgi:hypothetical protein